MTRALRRSLDVYYRDQARAARMDCLNAGFMGPGALAFDIGAHLGDRTGSFHRLGARVVACEPQPQIFRALRLLQGRKPGVTLGADRPRRGPGRDRAASQQPQPHGRHRLARPDRRAKGAATWQGQVWDDRIQVPVTTLDALIATHGLPDFVKIDVEGHELAVLDGLSTAIPALSFEMTTIQRDVALACPRPALGARPLPVQPEPGGRARPADARLVQRPADGLGPHCPARRRQFPAMSSPACPRCAISWVPSQGKVLALG